MLDIESYIGVMHTLFTMEDLYGLRIDKLEAERFKQELDELRNSKKNNTSADE